MQFLSKISKVYFIPWNRREKFYDFLKATGVFNCIKKKNFLAIKIHFGEDGNNGYIRPKYVVPVVKIVKKNGAYPFLTDASTIYVGKRSDAYHHLFIANKHGFTIEYCDCPIIIADGIKGNTEKKIGISLNHFNDVYISSEIYNADSFVFMSHFKGHEITGFGGALKNIGMGCGSKSGKYAMHHSSKPLIEQKSCIGCGFCIKNCYYKALSIKNNKIIVNKDRCAGCGQCIVTCESKVFRLNWDDKSAIVQEKIVEYAFGVLKGKSGIYINFLNHISKYCDCFGITKNDPIMHDVGIIVGTDPVATDQASYDIINTAYGKNLFRNIYPEIDSTIQLDYAEKIGLGNRNYTLVKY
ncbi:MAG: DUF362 domain-containing protein [Endomicrobium sp.]|jgi:uncharacterized Fe-S center protein|nr:DUF362 domain-containing protein [Endomicrobium sp.]